MEIKVPAAVRAAKRAMRVVPVMAFLFAERESLFSIGILLGVMNLPDRSAWLKIRHIEKTSLYKGFNRRPETPNRGGIF
jgi:hypothetical protein